MNGQLTISAAVYLFLTISITGSVVMILLALAVDHWIKKREKG